MRIPRLDLGWSWAGHDHHSPWNTHLSISTPRCGRCARPETQEPSLFCILRAVLFDRAEGRAPQVHPQTPSEPRAPDRRSESRGPDDPRVCRQIADISRISSTTIGSSTYLYCRHYLARPIINTHEIYNYALLRNYARHATLRSARLRL